MLLSLFTFRRTFLAIRKIIKNRRLINSCITVIHQKPVKHECINLGRQDAVSTKFRTMVPNICGYSARNTFHTTIMASKILRWLPHIPKMCAALLQNRSTSQKVPPPYTVSELSSQCITDGPYSETSLSSPHPYLFNSHRNKSLLFTPTSCQWSLIRNL